MAVKQFQVRAAGGNVPQSLQTRAAWPARAAMMAATLVSALFAIGCAVVTWQSLMDDDDSPATRWTMVISGAVFAIAFLAGPVVAWKLGSRRRGVLAAAALALPFAAFAIWFMLPGRL
jgi:hypothetical protein